MTAALVSGTARGENPTGDPVLSVRAGLVLLQRQGELCLQFPGVKGLG